jgi:hypothetical protein
MQIEVDGLLFGVELVPDECQGPPWKEEDGHGPVSEWTTRRKAPGERVLAVRAGRYLYYDFEEACEIALRDGWGGFSGTPKQQATLAAEADFQRLKAYCDDKWWYVGVVVELLDDDGDSMGLEKESIHGIESDGDYWREVAVDLAEIIIYREKTILEN